MTNQIQHLTHQDVEPHIYDYMIKSFPVNDTNWRYKWHYNNGADEVKITLTINGKTGVYQVPVSDIVDATSR